MKFWKWFKIPHIKTTRGPRA